MNYAQTAQSLASQGRYGDSMLVHMTPREVGGLQALARSQGTSLTINPNTGLPEAFSLRNFLPAIAGAALTIGSGGTLSPLTIGLMTGGIGALATGSLKEGLMMGLGAAGGAGLAGSMANLAAPAAEGVSQAALLESQAGGMTLPSATAPSAAGVLPGAGSVSTAAPNAADIMAGGLPEAGTTIVPSAPLADPITMGTPGGSGNLFAAELEAFGPQGLSEAAASGTPTYMAQMPTPPSYMDKISGGFDKATSSMDAFGNYLGNNKMNLAMSAAPMLTPPEIEPVPEQEQFIRPYTLDIDNVSGQDTYAPGSTQEREQLRYRYNAQPIFRAAQGGIVALAQGGESVAAPFSAEITPEAAKVYQSIARTQGLAGMPMLDVEQFVVRSASKPTRSQIERQILDTAEKNYDIYRPNPEDSASYMEIKRKAEEEAARQTEEASTFARGGIAAFKQGREVRKKIDRSDPFYKFADPSLEKAAMENFAKGGVPNVPRFLSGGGDGMSDDIPAVIGNKQPARLADGEFVIPADVVSHLGNGSSKAGAKQLYAMMDRIRKQRTGKKSQAPEVNPRKLMPA
jgi:hypothetical protein